MTVEGDTATSVTTHDTSAYAGAYQATLGAVAGAIVDLFLDTGGAAADAGTNTHVPLTPALTLVDLSTLHTESAGAVAVTVAVTCVPLALASASTVILPAPNMATSTDLTWQPQQIYLLPK